MSKRFYSTWSNHSVLTSVEHDFHPSEILPYLPESYIFNINYYKPNYYLPEGK